MRFPREHPAALPRPLGEPGPEGVVEQDLTQRRGPRGRLVGVEEQPALAVGDDRRQAAHGGGDHGRPGGLGLGGDEAERLVVRRHGDHRRGGVPQRELGRRHRRHEADDVRDAEPIGQLGQRLGVLETGAGRSADDRDDQAGPEGRRLVEQQGHRAQQHVGRLERLEPTGEQDDVRVRRQVQATARLVGVARAEDGQVDTGLDDLDAAGVRVVQVDQLLGLDVGAGDEHVGRLDHLLLADDPRDGLGGVADRERVVLDLGHRVHGVHQRHAPAVTRERAHLAGEPVVGVHEVVVAERLGRLGAQHLAREHAQLRRQLALAQALEGAGMDVVHGDAVARGQHRLVPRGRRAGEDVDLDPGGGEPSRQLEDVDVQASGIAGAGLVERRGVHADHGHPAYGVGLGELHDVTPSPAQSGPKRDPTARSGR